MAQYPCIGLYKLCVNLPFGDGDRHVQLDHGVLKIPRNRSPNVPNHPNFAHDAIAIHW